jgi:hypothetical protein
MIHSRILSCNAENAADNLPPLDFAEANELVKTALARRGFTDALPTDVAPYGRVEGRLEGRLDGQRGSFRGGRGGGIVRPTLKINGKQVCQIWNNMRPCNGTPTADGCKSQSGEERLHKCSWVDNGKLCGKDPRNCSL